MVTPVCLAAQPCLTLKVPFNESHFLSRKFMGDLPYQFAYKIVCCDLIITDLITEGCTIQKVTIILPRSAPIYASCPA